LTRQASSIAETSRTAGPPSGAIRLATRSVRIHHCAIRRTAALAREHGHAANGYRTVFNCNSRAGQTVFHIHPHLPAGRRLGRPPG
jgi:hypothetical protein